MTIKSPNIPLDPLHQMSTKPYNICSNAKVNVKATPPAKKQPSPVVASQAQPPQNISNDEDPQSVFEATTLFMIANHLSTMSSQSTYMGPSMAITQSLQSIFILILQRCHLEQATKKTIQHRLQLGWPVMTVWCYNTSAKHQTS